MIVSIATSVSAVDLNESSISNEDSLSDEVVSSAADEESKDELSVNENSDVVSTDYTPKSYEDIKTSVDYAKNNDTIILSGNYVFNETITVNKQLTFVGINNATVDGNFSVGLFKVNVNGVLFKNITFINGYSDEGGAIYSKNSFNVENCKFINNTATTTSFSRGGGAVYGGSCVNCSFVNNFAKSEGGAIFFSKVGSVVNCSFVGNSAIGGGAIYFYSGGSAVGCSFVNNSANFQSGGAVYGGSAVGCSFVNNSAIRDGGAVSGGSAVGCSFFGNSAGYGGGALDGGSAVGCSFVNNSASSGGAVYGGSCVNCSFVGNSAGYDGGAVSGGSAVGCSFVNNSAIRDGGAVSGGSAVGCSFVNNSASSGGAVSGCSCVNCSFVDNSAETYGGAISGDKIEIVNCTFFNNLAKNGGAVYNVVVINCSFTHNNATQNGGAMFEGFAINCSYNNNHANINGGAIYNGVSFNSIFELNSANSNGGAIDGKKATNCSFIRNTAGFYGGAVNNAEISTDSKFQENSASMGDDCYNVTYCDLVKSFSDLYNLFDNNYSDIYIDSNYSFDLSSDYYLNEGIIINRSIIIHGNGFTINGYSFSRIFNVISDNVVFKDLIFINGYVKSNGGAIHFSSGGSCVNCSFVDNSAVGYGGAVSGGSCVNCSFVDNSAETYGGAVHGGSCVNCSFVNNSASSGGAIYFYSGGSAVGCSFVNNSASSGGAVSGGSCVNCSFVGNSAKYDGGAVSGGSCVNCSFINNSANWGGAVRGGSAVGCSFVNNSAVGYGGAVSGGSCVNCIFISNDAEEGGAIRYCDATNCTFTKNHAEYGGTIYGGDAINCSFVCNYVEGAGSCLREGNAQNCIFINNSVGSGIIFNCPTVVNCSFINNSITCIREGSTVVNCIFVGNSATSMSWGSAVNCSFVGNSATSMSRGSAVNCSFINNSVIGSCGAMDGPTRVLNCIFINNSATDSGGAIVGRSFSLIENCIFMDNHASNNGGALYEGIVVNSSFVNNSANFGGAIYMYSRCNIAYCNFTNCFANSSGGAIFWNQSANITYCTFSNCTSKINNTCLAFNPSQTSNYTVCDCIFDVDPNNINYYYVSNLIAGNLTYFNGEEGLLIVKLYNIKGALTDKVITLAIDNKKFNVTTDSNGSAYFKIHDYISKAGIYNSSVSFEGNTTCNPVITNITITINRHETILDAKDLILYKNEYGNLIANLSNIRGPLNNKKVIFKINNIVRTITTRDDGSAVFNVLNYVSAKGEYRVGITFEGDDFNTPASANVSFIYVDFKGILTGNVDGKYFNDTILNFNLLNYRNNKPISDATIKLNFSNGEIVYLVTDVDGNVSYRIPFVPDYYSVVASIDDEFASANNVTFDEIEINKIFGLIEHSLLNGNKTLRFKLVERYNKDALRNIELNLKFNNGEEAKIITDDNGVASYDIPFPKGVYSVSISVNGDYKDFEDDYIGNIVITNDLNCSINFTNNITFDFGGFGSTNFTVDGGTVELGNIRVVDHPEALISISNSTISVFGLAVGDYILEVETTPDDYHNAVIGVVNITVHNAPSKVKFSTGISFEYGGSASIYVSVDGGSVNSKSIKVLGHSEAKITFAKNLITISGLNPGTYTLYVESIPDSNHKTGNGTVGITVRKATAVIKASKLTVALKSGTVWTIKIVDSKTKNPISNMKVTLNVYTGKKYKTVSLTTNSKGEANYKTSSLKKGNHKVVVGASHKGYNFNTLTSSIKVIKAKKLTFKVKKNVGKDGSTLSITVKYKKKPINKVKLKLLVYTGKKYKTVVLKSKTKGKFKGVCGWGTNKISVGTHKIVIKPVSIKYKGSKKVKLKIKKSAKKAPKWETKI